MMQHYLRSLFRARLRAPFCLMTCGLLLSLALCDNAQAADFFAIITNLGNAPHDHAQLDVSIDTSATGGLPASIPFVVFRASDGVLLANFTVTTNAQGFASSALAAPPNDNLFAISGGLTALVKATTPVGVPTATAVLRQTVQGAKIILGVPSVTISGSTRVSVAIGDIMKGTHLLIANVTLGQAAIVDVFFGTTGAQGTGRYKNGNLQPDAVFEVDLASTDANSNVIVASSAPVIVQLAVDDGKLDETMVLPTP